MTEIRVPKDVCGEGFLLNLQTRKILCDNGYQTSVGRLHHRNYQHLDDWMKENDLQFKSARQKQTR